MNIIILLGIVVTLATGIPVLLQMLRNHPRGLIILFFAEMWERFSFYGMRGLLIFYLTQHFLFSDDFSSSQYGSYGSPVYLLPLGRGIVGRAGEPTDELQSRPYLASRLLLVT